MSVRSRSRSPMKGDDDEPRFLFIGNLPKEWKYFHIKEFLVEQYLTDLDVIEDMGHIFMLKDRNAQLNGECLVAFDSVECCQSALKALQGAVCQGKKLVVMTDTGTLLQVPRPSKAMRQKESMKKRFYEQQKPVTNKQKANQGQQGDDHETKRMQKTYGLSKEFLESLNIQPPLVCRVFITNLSPEVTDGKLREVFSLAGHVVCTKRLNNWGKVLYDHPVEAVQAISMFHGQMLYKHKMVVQMDRSKLPILPEGLEDLGEGLGFSGKPMRSVRLRFELQKLEEQLQQQVQPTNTNQLEINPLSVNTNQAQNNPLLTLLQLLQGQVDGNAAANLLALQANAMNQFNNVQSQQTPPTSRFDIPPSALALAQNPLGINPLAQNPLANAQNPLASLQNALGFQNPMGQNQQAPRSRFDVPPSNALTMAPTAPLAANASTSGLNQNWGSGQNNWNSYQNTPQTSQNQPSGYGNSDRFKHNPDEFDVQRLSDLNKSEDAMKSSDMLLFQNLPPSVTSKALVNKMREVGELLFAEMTGQGRAVVRFRDVRDAERCVKLYDRSKVDGQVISVKLF